MGLGDLPPKYCCTIKAGPYQNTSKWCMPCLLFAMICHLLVALSLNHLFLAMVIRCFLLAISMRRAFYITPPAVLVAVSNGCCSKSRLELSKSRLELSKFEVLLKPGKGG